MHSIWIFFSLSDDAEFDNFNLKMNGNKICENKGESRYGMYDSTLDQA